ncbi:n-alkane-inducible cytochrome P450 [Penicillium hispanicum]|uniref:n-alkane-inducible cytochrome P450 n=1 Tax=Penicillium hispanicum TaxID=1080232 RepID=UPI0025400472|nr:n-alkane-inducible cytochrome P450 [Penicillium hispanicum]KAJ5594074.1 n-alkane-inducible cytochrome P450 [Penicillium hispanicum]
MRDIILAGKQRRFLKHIRGLFNAHGATFKAKTAGQTTIFTIEPKNVQAVLAIKFKDFDLGDNRNTSFRPLLGHGIFSTDGSKWEHSRALLRPNFNRNQITDINVYETHVSALIQQIPRDGSTVDLQNLFLRMVCLVARNHVLSLLLTHQQTLDSATEFLFGESVHSLGDDSSPLRSSFATDFNDAQEGLVTRFRMGPFRRFHRDKKFSRAVVNTRAYVDLFVQKAIEHRIALDRGEKVSSEAQKLDEQQYVFLYELSKRTLDRTELTDQLLNILLAGRDTTASLLSITFFTLAKRPDIWNKLRREVLALEGRKPSFQDLKSMSYLTWVLNESKRPDPSHYIHPLLTDDV